MRCCFGGALGGFGSGFCTVLGFLPLHLESPAYMDPPHEPRSGHGDPLPGRSKIVLRSSKIIYVAFHEGIRDKSDFVSVSVSIMVPFWRAWERQKWGFRVGGLHFLQISGDARWDAVLVAFSDGLGQDSELFWASRLPLWSLQPKSTWTPSPTALGLHGHPHFQPLKPPGTLPLSPWSLYPPLDPRSLQGHSPLAKALMETLLRPKNSVDIPDLFVLKQFLNDRTQFHNPKNTKRLAEASMETPLSISGIPWTSLICFSWTSF